MSNPKSEMFRSQREQKAGGKNRSGSAGVCGKNAAVSRVQDEFAGAIITFGKGAERDRLCGERTGLQTTRFWINKTNKPDVVGSLKTIVTLGLRGLAAYANHAVVLGCENGWRLQHC